MSLTFASAEQLFKKNEINTIARDEEGLRYLKLRSLSRNVFLQEMLELAGIEVPNIKKSELFSYLYESKINSDEIDYVIQHIYKRERANRAQQENVIIDELYKMDSFAWGGLHQNSLEKTIVDNYVKKVISYEELNDKIDNELHVSMRDYVRSSWYNHWTSIIIEDIFKDNDFVLPAVGLIKKIDFFISDMPFDLKVTYLPEGYVKDMRRRDEQKPEITVLKKLAKQCGVYYGNDLNESQQSVNLRKKLGDIPSDAIKNVLWELDEYRAQLIDAMIDNPTDIIRWLYEKQGVRRFDASNKIFLLLIDKSNYSESWKLKRAKPYIEKYIHGAIETIKDRPGKNITFKWDGISYNVKSEVIVITKG